MDYQMKKVTTDCEWCDRGDTPDLLDCDGVKSSISGQPGILSHAYEDAWWPCPRAQKGAA
jgi:hypothetical protein